MTNIEDLSSLQHFLYGSVFFTPYIIPILRILGELDIAPMLKIWPLKSYTLTCGVVVIWSGRSAPPIQPEQPMQYRLDQKPAVPVVPPLPCGTWEIHNNPITYQCRSRFEMQHALQG